MFKKTRKQIADNIRDGITTSRAYAKEEGRIEAGYFHLEGWLAEVIKELEAE